SLPSQFVRNHGGLGRHRRSDSDAHPPSLHRFHQRPKVAVAREQHHVIDMTGNLHGVDGEFDVHVALYFAAAGLIDEFLGGLGDDRIAIVIEPVDQRPDRGILLILHHGGIIKRPQQITAGLKLAQQAFVVDVESQRLRGRVEICSIYEQRYFLTGYCHWWSLSIKSVNPSTRPRTWSMRRNGADLRQRNSSLENGCNAQSLAKWPRRGRYGGPI